MTASVTEPNTGLIDGLIHEQYHTDDGDLVVFRCSECGYVSMSLGGLHGHIERHRGYTRFNIQVPFTRTAIANVPRLMNHTELLRVSETEQIALEEVDGL